MYKLELLRATVHAQQDQIVKLPYAPVSSPRTDSSVGRINTLTSMQAVSGFVV